MSIEEDAISLFFFTRSYYWGDNQCLLDYCEIYVLKYQKYCFAGK